MASRKTLAVSAAKMSSSDSAERIPTVHPAAELRGKITVEQKFVARGKELCNASNYSLLVVAKFPVIGERIPVPSQSKLKPPLDDA